MTEIFLQLDKFDEFLGILRKHNVSAVETQGIKVDFNTEDKELTPAIGFSVAAEPFDIEEEEARIAENSRPVAGFKFIEVK